MNTHTRFLLPLVIVTLCIFSVAPGQVNPWTYVGKITFPVADSIAARPYLCHLDQNERLWVISTKVDDINAHNAIYYANPSDTVFKKFIDYDLNGDSDTLTGHIGAIRGITTLGNDLVITASEPYPKTKTLTVSAAYYYKNADTNTVERFGWLFTGAGYGSYINGAEMSKDSMLVAGIYFGTSIRWYNWGYRFKKSARGSWNTPDTNNTSIFSNATEGGVEQTNGVDVIRDLALIPNGDYFSKTTPFYTSRNSFSPTRVTGGIAVWQGGTQVQPINYTNSRLTDFDGFLAFAEAFPYGITVDTRGILWVAGLDSTRRWAKGFKVEGVNALAMYDLPSTNSTDVPDPKGAPMLGPSDVAVTRDVRYAYVIDRYARCAWKFRSSASSVQDVAGQPLEFTLHQNYPNPFNPATVISYTVPAGGYVRLTVTDMLGREVRTLVDGHVSPGEHKEIFDASNLPSGTYLYTLRTETATRTRAMLFVK